MDEKASPQHEVEASLPSHELSRSFAERGVSLNATLVEMLDEHFSHRTERRGCGYTQATRHLAVLVNRPRVQLADTIAKLFPRWARVQDRSPPDPEQVAGPLRDAVRAVMEALEREESRLLAAIIADLVRPLPASAHELRVFDEEIKVGTCPLAEKYFLEITDRFLRPKGRANVLVSAAGEPLLIEKINLGDSHSCVNVAELVVNGVRLPPGCLFGVAYDGEVEVRPNKALRGGVIPVDRCAGFRFLRLTTLAVSPPHRARAFSAHFQAQVDAPLYQPDTATIGQLRQVAMEQL